MLDLDAELILGVSAAGIKIGQSVASILQENLPDAIEQRNGCRVLKYGPVWVFENYRAIWGGDDTDTEGVVSQVCVHAGYRGKIAGSIGIGSHITEVEAAFGSLEHIDGREYQVDLGTPWDCTDWTFEVEKGSPSIGQPGWGEARLACICVF